ncbi:cystathionine gamma-lyase-like isoform X2 [Tachypleus tridentatus]|uniref:cystathionine gamma-lyase-like isoform X2 n=1 Tax=Tachypleus tridentatus TaxID=6853 RepID=UPI003FD68F23
MSFTLTNKDMLDIFRRQMYETIPDKSVFEQSNHNNEEVVDIVGRSRDEHFATKAVHEGQDSSQWTHKAVVPPICTATTFCQFSPEKHEGFEYGRCGNPTRKCLEQCLASLEGGKYALCFSSGLSAVMSVTHLLNSGDHIICFDDVYGGTSSYFKTCAERMGIETSFVDARDPVNIDNAFQTNTKMVWLETPTNPTLKLADIAAVARIVRKHCGALLVVDNTLMSSYFQRPLDYGADISMQSLSKYMNGHSDVMMGTIITNQFDLWKKLHYLQKIIGAVPSPFDCYLVNRGLKTLSVRMEKHMQNGLAVAKFLESHPLVQKLIYPGLPSHPQHDLACRQCSGFSGVVTFFIKGDLKETEEFVKHFKLFTLAVSLGDVESLVEIPSLNWGSFCLLLKTKLQCGLFVLCSPQVSKPGFQWYESSDLLLRN